MNEKSGYTPTNPRTIRSRLAGVVVVPSVVLLIMWAVFSSYTLFDGIYMRTVASSVKDATIPSVDAFAGLQKERRLSLELLSKAAGVDAAALNRQQDVTDESVGKMKAAFTDLADSSPQDVVDRINAPETTSGFRLHVERIDGSVYGKLTLRNVQFGDTRGTFATAPTATLDYRPLAYLFSGRIDVRELVGPQLR